MAVTIINPAFLSSLQDDLWTIASSTNSGQTDFKYVFDIYNGANQLVRCKVYPDPTNGKGYFDAGPVVRNEIKYDWFCPYNDGTGPGSYLGNNNVSCLSIPGYNGEIGVQYNIRVGEDFSGVTTLNLASGTVTAGNWAAPLFKRKQNPQNIFDLKYHKYLTNRPKNIRYNFKDKLIIPFYNWNDIWTSNYNLKIRLNKSTGAWTNGYSFYNINNCPWLQLDIGVLSLARSINGNTYWQYFDSFDTIEVGFFAGTTYYDSIFLNKTCNPLYNPTNLYFINAYGMYDTACFNLVSKLNLDTERKSFTKIDKKFNTSSVDYYQDGGDGMVYYESKINYASKTNWIYKLTMDFPTDEEYEWLSELILSPQIYAEIDGDYYPVTIKNTNYEYIKHNVQGLRVLELDIELNQTRYSFTR